MTEEKMVLITLEKYQHLVRQSTRLDQLECTGVDNWSGYSEYSSITGVDGWDEIENAAEACEKDIYNE